MHVVHPWPVPCVMYLSVAVTCCYTSANESVFYPAFCLSVSLSVCLSLCLQLDVKTTDRILRENFTGDESLNFVPVILLVEFVPLWAKIQSATMGIFYPEFV